MRRLAVVALLLLAALPALPAAAQTAAGPPLTERLEAARTLARVQSALAGDPQLARFVLSAAARDGAVVLSGTVATEAARARAEQVARGVRGVGAVSNAIRVDAQAGRTSGRLPPPVRTARPEVRSAEPPQVEAMTPAPPAAAPSAPAPSAPAAQERATHHTVRSGDTLGAIARQHGVSVQQLQQLNNIRGTTIRVGQRLRVR